MKTKETYFIEVIKDEATLNKSHVWQTDWIVDDLENIILLVNGKIKKIHIHDCEISTTIQHKQIQGFVIKFYPEKVKCTHEAKNEVLQHGLEKFFIPTWEYTRQNEKKEKILSKKCLKAKKFYKNFYKTEKAFKKPNGLVRIGFVGFFGIASVIVGAFSKQFGVASTITPPSIPLTSVSTTSRNISTGSCGTENQTRLEKGQLTQNESSEKSHFQRVLDRLKNDTTVEMNFYGRFMQKPLFVSVKDKKAMVFFEQKQPCHTQLERKLCYLSNITLEKFDTIVNRLNKAGLEVEGDFGIKTNLTAVVKEMYPQVSQDFEVGIFALMDPLILHRVGVKFWLENSDVFIKNDKIAVKASVAREIIPNETKIAPPRSVAATKIEFGYKLNKRHSVGMVYSIESWNNHHGKAVWFPGWGFVFEPGEKALPIIRGGGVQGLQVKPKQKNTLKTEMLKEEINDLVYSNLEVLKQITKKVGNKTPNVLYKAALQNYNGGYKEHTNGSENSGENSHSQAVNQSDQQGDSGSQNEDQSQKGSDLNQGGGSQNPDENGSQNPDENGSENPDENDQGIERDPNDVPRYDTIGYLDRPLTEFEKRCREKFPMAPETLLQYLNPDSNNFFEQILNLPESDDMCELLDALATNNGGALIWEKYIQLPLLKRSALRFLTLHAALAPTPGQSSIYLTIYFACLSCPWIWKRVVECIFYSTGPYALNTAMGQGLVPNGVGHIALYPHSHVLLNSLAQQAVEALGNAVINFTGQQVKKIFLDARFLSGAVLALAAKGLLKIGSPWIRTGVLGGLVVRYGVGRLFRTIFRR